MKKWKKAGLWLLAALLTLALSGCMMETAAEDLYSLPQLSEGYLQLQGAISEVLSGGAVYAAPSSGSNRQPIQREDIDGDGVREVLAFFNEQGSDKPMKIFIFRSDGDEYKVVARIEGEGTGIDSVAYLDMDDDGVREIAVGWQMGPGIYMLSVYSLKGWQVNQVINTNYTEYTVCSLDRLAGNGILVLRLTQSELGGEAEYYSLTADGEVVSSTARLSAGVEALSRVRTTNLLSGGSAVLVESSTMSGSRTVTDIFAYSGGRLKNITINENTGASDETIRTNVNCRDINGDGVLDVPHPVALPTTSESTVYYMTEWYSYYLTGRRTLVMTTYSNYTDNWYLALPDEWIGKIAVRREDASAGERAIVFSAVDDDGQIREDFLAVYTLTGENRTERAAGDGRFVLLEEDETVFSAKILVQEERFELPVSQELIRSSFGYIYSEWITGET